MAEATIPQVNCYNFEYLFNSCNIFEHCLHHFDGGI